MVKNPFTPQYPISPELFFDRDELIERFIFNIEQSKEGSLTNMAFFGKFGIGKTSLLRKLESLEISKNIPKVYITLKATYANSFEEVIGYIYNSLTTSIKKFADSHKIKINIPHVKLESDEKFTKDYFREYMIKLWSNISKKADLILVLIDDFYLAYEYSMDIRNCFQELQQKKCRYMLVITTIPETLKFGRREDPVKRFFDWNEVKEFTEKNTINMIKSIINKSELELSVSIEVLKDIYTKTRGHPYYICLFLNEIIRKLRTTFDREYSLSDREEEAMKYISYSKDEIFTPSVIPGVSSATATLTSLEEKEVVEKIAYGKYRFKHPLIKEYFKEKYGEDEYD